MNQEASIDRLLADYLQAVEAGKMPDREALLTQHPHLAEELRAFFRDHDRMNRVAAPLQQMDDPERTLLPGEPIAAPTVVRYFGDYEVLSEIARGGMGIVYRARQVSLQRTVALKMILAGQLATTADVQRFRQEAHAAAQLDHPHILPIYEIGEHEGQQYFSMKLIKGGSLADWLKKNRTAEDAEERRGISLGSSASSAVRILVQVARAVHHAHQHGVMHRDLKPANVLLDQNGTPYVTDFGLAKHVTGDSGLTQSGAIVGTPSYMAPEQAQAKKQLTTAVDVYSLGAILYELLTGRPPFRAATPLDTVLQVLERDPEPPWRVQPAADRDLSIIALKCLEKDPARRYGTAAELADDLERWQGGEPILARPASTGERVLKWARRRPAVAALILLAQLSLLGFLVISLVSRSAIEAREAQTKQALHREQQTALEREAARQQAVNALASERTAAYFTALNLAYNEWRHDNAGRAEQLLDNCPIPQRGWEWRHLKRVCHAEDALVTAHARGLYGMHFSPDGARLLTIGADGHLRIWDSVTGKLQVDFVKHDAQSVSAAFSPDSQRVVSVSSTEVLHWEAASGRLLPPIVPMGRGAWQVAFHPDGRHLVLIDKAQQGRVLELATGKETEPFAAQQTQYRNDGKELIVIQAGKLLVCDPLTGKAKSTLLENLDKYTSLSVSSASPRLAVASAGKVTVWDLTGMKLLHSFYFAPNSVGCLTLSANGQRLAVGQERSVRFWDLETGVEGPPLHGLGQHGLLERMLDVAFSPDGRRLATATGDVAGSSGEWNSSSGFAGVFARLMLDAALEMRPAVEVRLWETDARQEARSLPDQAAGSNALALSPSGVLAVAKEGSIHLWDVSARKKLHELNGHRGVVHALSFTPSGNLLISSGKDATVRIWDPNTGKELRQLKAPLYEVLTLTCLDERRVAGVSGSPRGVVWDLSTGEQLFEFFTPSGGGTFLAAGLPERSLYRATTGSFQLVEEGVKRQVGAIHVIDAETGKRKAPLEGLQSYLYCLAVRDDGKMLAAADGDEVIVHDLLAGKPPRRFPGQSGTIHAIAFGPDQDTLATATESTIKLWSISLGKEKLTLSGGAAKLAFDPQGRFLVAADSEGVRIYDATEPPVRVVPPSSAADQTDGPIAPAATPADVRPPVVRDALGKAENCLARNDVPGSLLWTVHALEHETDAGRQTVHRIRIHLLLQQLPRLGETQAVAVFTPVMPAKSEGQVFTLPDPTGRWLAVGQSDKGKMADWLQIYDLRTGQATGVRIQPKHGFHQGTHQLINFSTDGQRFVVAMPLGDDPWRGPVQVQLYETATGKAVGPLIQLPARPLKGSRFRLHLTADNRYLLREGSLEGTGALGDDRDRLLSEVFDLTTGKPLTFSEPYNQAAISKSDRFLFTSWSAASGGGMLSDQHVVHDLQTGKLVGPSLQSRYGSHDRALVANDGQSVVILQQQERMLRVYDTATGQCRFRLKFGLNNPHLSLSSDGLHLVYRDSAPSSVPSFQGRVDLRDLRTGNRIAPEFHTDSWPKRVEFSADGRFVLVENDRKLRLVETATGDPVGPWLSFTDSGREDVWSSPQDYVLTSDGETLLTRDVWVNDYLGPTRFRMWNLKPDTRAPEELRAEAMLQSGRKISERGDLEALDLRVYQDQWRQAQSRWSGLIAADVPPPARAPTPPPAPPVDPANRPKTPRPAQNADYATVLNRFPKTDEPPLASLSEALLGDDSYVRTAALEALTKGSVELELKLAILQEAMQDEAARDAAASLLATLGPAARPAVPRLIAEVQAGLIHDKAAFVSSIQALGKIGPEAKAAVPVLREVVLSSGNAHSNVDAEVARTLGRIGPAAAEAVPDLGSLLRKYGSGNTRTVILRAIERIARNADESVVRQLATHLRLPTAEERKKDPHDGMRTGLVDLLGRLGPRGQPVLPAVEALLKEAKTGKESEDDELQVAALEARWRITGRSDGAVKAMLEILQAPPKDSQIMRGRRGRAARLLGSLGKEARSAAPVLKQMLASGQLLGDRLEAAEAIWRIEGDAGLVLPVIRAVVSGVLKPSGYGPNGEDWTKPLQARAIEILGLMGPSARPAAPALVAAMEQEAAAEDPTVWLRISKADEEDDDPNIVDLLRRVGLESLRKIDMELAKQTEKKLFKK